MHDPDFEARAISISIRLMHSCEARNIETLKKVLAGVPDRRCTRYVLTSAVLEVCATSVSTTRWLLEYAELFRPEVNVVAIVTQLFAQILTEYQFVQNQHYSFNPQGGIVISSIEQERLIATVPQPSHGVFLATICSLIQDS